MGHVGTIDAVPKLSPSWQKPSVLEAVFDQLSDGVILYDRNLVVTGVNSISWQKNYCSGGIVAEETAKDAHSCNVQVYHDSEHPSAIQLPLR